MGGRYIPNILVLLFLFTAGLSLNREYCSGLESIARDHGPGQMGAYEKPLFYSGNSKEERNLLIAFDDSYMLANPDWVHPFNRKNYPGYAIRKEKKKTGRDWSYKTNRPGGNTRGGGTTAYYSYRSFYRNTLKSRVKTRKQR